MTLPSGFNAADVTPAVLAHLPAFVRDGFTAGYAETIQTVFLIAVPIAALTIAAAWLIPQVELRRWSPAPDGATTDGAVTDGAVTDGATDTGEKLSADPGEFSRQ